MTSISATCLILWACVMFCRFSRPVSFTAYRKTDRRFVIFHPRFISLCSDAFSLCIQLGDPFCNRDRLRSYWSVSSNAFYFVSKCEVDFMIVIHMDHGTLCGTGLLHCKHDTIWYACTGRHTSHHVGLICDVCGFLSTISMLNRNLLLLAFSWHTNM
jgi:hypothetical protein